jgi:hypothetical protein
MGVQTVHASGSKRPFAIFLWSITVTESTPTDDPDKRPEGFWL